MKIYFDGGCRPNPGAMRTAVVAGGRLTIQSDLGTGSSEQAEWLALLAALDVASALGERDPLLLGDCAGVVAQANGARSRSAAARACRASFDQAVSRFDRVRVRHIKRQQNLAGIAMAKLDQQEI